MTEHSGEFVLPSTPPDFCWFQWPSREGDFHTAHPHFCNRMPGHGGRHRCPCTATTATVGATEPAPPGQRASGPVNAPKVWVVVKETPYEPSTVLGVCATRQLADLLASHPYDSATVMEFELIAPEEPEAALSGSSVQVPE